jgi:hypothetical protein
MNQAPADGTLVQAKEGTTDLPVAMTLGGSLVPFNNPQEVIDVGQGADWASRVVAISGGSYNRIGFIPSDGTLIQGTGGGISTPVAAIVGGARINYASPQELVDAGFGTDWASKVRAVPTRHFNLMPTVPSDGTLIQGSVGSTPVAAIIGTARVNFGSPQEVIDAGFGTDWASKVRAIPERAFSALPIQIMDGTRIKNGASTSQAVVVGGAKMPFASIEELNGSGYGDRPVWTVPSRTWDALPEKIADGTRIKNAGSAAQAAIIGRAKVPFASIEELNAAGYGDDPLYVVPARVWNELPNDIGDGTRIGKAGNTAQGAVVGGAKVPFSTIEELEGAGYVDKPLHILPPRVWDALPEQIGDGTRVVKAGSTSEGAIVGGAKVEFHSMDELVASG